MPYFNEQTFYNKIAEANELYYQKKEYKLYYQKLNEIICTGLDECFGFITPEELQNMTLSQIIDNEAFIIPFLSLYSKEITYISELDETCYIQANKDFDFGKIYSYYLSIPDTTNKLTKISYLSCKINDYNEKIEKDRIQYELEEEKRAEENMQEYYEEEKQSRIYYWTMADRYSL